jgi:hypothetical protein
LALLLLVVLLARRLQPPPRRASRAPVSEFADGTAGAEEERPLSLAFKSGNLLN